ncbi:serine protease [Mesorhizobium sp. M1C.F.Ca.ET.193.01.1.1]|uniref:S1C family serine protease n=1 Tax=unclassified Mesorhizobium TaxID=325217 RepID=UPI000FD411CB|nr:MULTISPECIES: S1C family serine protease [unclassified Mesorhizobium]TGT02224.1 serine protease [bacterium M00.F.Ca.ET.177.01.1.1]TGQ54476.1 serine protease [Mesorhizobium sp. M1C.F.Ca.ET.210.01.1.1]TGQ72472.1 serine protease [Mesorhizobium sp. M1C.F.Ca.ET.212.01.1.1]TGR10268.1 serine protease [Mesorhizobium sp. M1C.F.Ca.ET.204.01.1.1]TGR30871.1 serine protease [Mesorhizobium sp. M1C.F.Ca.ET.196.01.1.1]
MSDFNLSAFSDAIADVAAAAAPAVASFATHHHRTASAFHWRDGFFVTAEEAVEAGEEIELTLASGETVKAELVGRDPSTGVALLKPASAAAGLPQLPQAAAVRPGHVAIAVGGSEGTSLAVFGSVGEVGPAWRSMRGGTIDRRINLAINTGSRFEGGPVLDAKGGLIGMLLFGPRRRALVMPYETIERAVATLREKGHVARGYLGAGLHPIRNGDAYGAMVMSLDDSGPAKAAGLHVGDIIVAWNGEAVHGPRELIRKLGPDSAGTAVTLGILSGGTQRDVSITIGEKPLS